jgi:hypothetical protein
MSSSIPTLSAAQWRKIAPLLPPTKRDVVMIRALLFRQTSGCGLRDVAQWFDLSRPRLSEWDLALRGDGSLVQVMEALKLDRASGGGWRCYSRDKKVAAAVTAIRFQNFRETLRR